MKTTRFCTLLLVLLGLVAAPIARAANIVWVSDNPNTNAAGVVTNVFSGPLTGGTPDDTFVTMLQAAGHNVIRFSSSDSQNFLLQPEDIDALNTNDLIILGRSIGSGAFQAPQAHQWNTNITKPLICQNAYLMRNSRLGWFTGSDDTPDGVPCALTIANFADPTNAYLFGGVVLNGAVMAGNYDIAFGRNTSHVNPTNLPVTGARVLARFGTTNVMVELKAGTAVKGGANVLAGYRLYFASGNREPNGGAIPTTAGTNNLTAEGQDIFLRAVTLALNNGVPPNLGIAPTVTTQPSNTNGCSGLPISLSLVATGENPLYYQWYHSDGATFTNPVTGGTNSVLTIANLQATNVGFYAAIVTNVVGSVTSSVASININGAGVVATGPANQTNCPGSTATFTTTATGSGTITYTWRKGATVVQGPDGNNSYSIASVVAADAGAYSVTVANDCNSVSNNFALTVVAAPTITAQPQNQTTPMGNGAVFSVTTTGFGTAPNTFQWQTNGVDVTGATGSTFAISNLTLAASGTQVRVAVSNCAGGLISSAATLTVTPITAITFDFNTPGQYTNAPYNLVNNDWMNSALVNQTPFGPVVPFEVSTGGVGIATGGGGLDLAFNNGTVNSSTLHPISYDFSLPGKTLVASAMIKIKYPTVNERNTQIGFVTTTNLDLDNSAGRTYMTVLLQSTAQPAPNFEIRYGSKASAANTFIERPAGGTVTLTTNRWYQLVATFTNTSAATSGTYTVTGTLLDRGPDGLASPTLVTEFTSILTNVDVTSAKNLFFVVRGRENCGVDYWDNFYAHTAFGDVAFVQQPASQTVLQGRTASFRALVDGTGPYSYQWNKNGSPIDGANNWKYTTPPLLSPADNGAQYTVTVTGPNNTITSSAATVTVTPDALDVLSVGSVNGSEIGLRFDQPVDKASAETAANYTINGVAATAAQLRVNNGVEQYKTNGTEVLLTPASPISGAFTVAVANVTSLSGTPIGGNSATGLVAGLTGFDVDPFNQVANQFSTRPGEEHSFAPGHFEVTAGGHDIFGNFDGFRFVFKQVTGDFDVKMRIPYLDALRTPNKGGFDARISLDAYSPHVGTYANPMLPGRNFIEGGYRPNWNVATVSWGNQPQVSYPNVWLRFRRVGNTFIRYSSANGVNWSCDGQIQTVAPGIIFPDTLYLGLAVNDNVGAGVMQPPVLAQLDSFGDFAGYPGAVITINTQPVNLTTNAGSPVTFTVAASATGGGIPAFGELTYVWQRTNTLSGGWTNVTIAGGTNSPYVTPALFRSDNGAQFRVIVRAPGAAPVTSSVVTVTVNDTAAATVVAAGTYVPTNSLNTMVITFSELLSAATALDAGNYALTNGAGQVFAISSVSFLRGDQSKIVITTADTLPAGTYGVRITGVQDLNGNAVAANTVALFTSYGVPPLYPVVIDYYGSLATAGNLGDLTGNVKFVNNTPDWIVYSNSFNVNGYATGFPSSADFGDNYGVRMYSYFVPTNSGQYVFWWRADDFAQFSMNTNATDSTNPVGKVSAPILAANNPNYTAANTFTTPVLTAGQAYYVEFIFKEGGGGDGGALAVTAGNSTATVPGATTVAPGTLFAFPDAVTQLPKVLVETYTGIPNWAPANGSIFDLQFATNSPNFVSRVPNRIQYERYMGYATNLGNTSLDNYAGRIISYFVPPASGNYRFYIRSDDSSVFYMNTNAVNSTDPAGKVRLGQLNAFTAAYTLAAQNVSLVGGQRYYMEGVWREGGGGDGMTVAVRPQADTAVPPATEVILGNMLEFPTNIALIGPMSLEPLVPVNPTVNEGTEINFVGSVRSGSPPYSFQWLRNGVQVFANQGVYKTPPLTFADNGAVFTVVVTNLFSAATQSVTVTVNQDLTPPGISNAVASQYGDSVLVTFTEKVDPATAAYLANYSIAGLQIYSLDFDELTRQRVSLRTSRQAPNTVYTLTVNGVRDASAAGNTIAANSTRNFTSWGFGGVGGVFVEVFTNIPTTLVQALFNDPRYIDNMPDRSYYTNTFSAGSFGAQAGIENYAIRLSGLFMPPSNGLYRFFIRGDDETRLYMNTNGPDPAGRVIIAENFNANSGVVGGFASPYQSGNAVGGDSSRAGASISPILSLTNGTPYYMEAFMKEGGGGDYVTVLMRAIDPVTLTEIGGLPTTAAATDSLGGSFFSAPGNPDEIQLNVVSAPPTEIFAAENELVDLRLVASVIPPSLTPFVSYQWARSNANSGVFIDVPGATGPALPGAGGSPLFFVPLADNNAAYRITASLPGTTLRFTTLMHVTADTVPPVMLAANSLGGNTIGIRYSEPVDPNSAGDPSNYYINGDINFTPLTATVRTNQDPSTVILTLSPGPGVPLSGVFTVDNLGVGDLASSQNFGLSQVSGTVQNLTPMDVGAPPGVGSSFSSTNTEIDVVAGGADIWGASDQGHMVLGTRNGNFDIWARLADLSRAPGDNDGITKAGIMVRESWDANARKVTYLAEPPASVGGRDIYEASHRITIGGASAALAGGNGNVGGPAGIPNTWIRIKRVGQDFTTFRSSNGVDWIQTSTDALGFSNTVYVGLAATAHIPSPSAATTTAKFRNVHVPDAPTITVQPAPADQTIPLHGSVSYSVTASNPPNAGALTYQWYRDGQAVLGATASTLNIPNLSGADTGLYTVKVGNDGGQVDSTAVNLVVSNAMIVVTNDSLSVTQGNVLNIPAATLIGNDHDPEAQALSLIAVSGLQPASFVADFDSGVPAGITLIAPAFVDATGGVNNSGVLKLTTATASQQGTMIINNLAPSRTVTAFDARFKVLVTGGSGNPADGFSFSFSTAPGAVGEEGTASGLVVAFDNYDNGGAEAPAIDLKWNNATLASTRIPKIQSPVYLDVAVRLYTDGKVDVSFGGSNVYSGFQTPYTPISGSFVFGGRTGGELETHFIDDISITTILTRETSREPTQAPLNGSLFGSAYVAQDVLHLTDAANSQDGGYAINNLSPGNAVTAFTATMGVQIGGGSADGADGMSFNLASDLPLGLGGTSEDGVGTGLSICIDNYVGGTLPAGPAVRVKYAGAFIASVQVPKWNNPAFIPVSIKLDADGTVDVMVNGTNVFTDLATPYAPINGRFGIYGRTGGLNQRHWVDNLVINATTTGGPASFSTDFNSSGYGTVVLNAGVVTYTPPAVACGTDTFYYLVTDNLGDTKVGQVNVSLTETNPQPPVILGCVPDQTVIGYTNSQVALPDLRSQLVALDSCGALTITQNPPPGTLLNDGTTNVVTFTVTDVTGSNAVCQATIIIRVDEPTFIPGTAVFTQPTGPFSAQFQTANGVNYRVEYTDSLNAPVTWNTLTTIAGNGAIATVNDPGPLPAMRYYRIVPLP